MIYLGVPQKLFFYSLSNTPQKKILVQIKNTLIELQIFSINIIYFGSLAGFDVKAQLVKMLNIIGIEGAHH